MGKPGDSLQGCGCTGTLCLSVRPVFSLQTKKMWSGTRHSEPRKPPTSNTGQSVGPRHVYLARGIGKGVKKCWFKSAPQLVASCLDFCGARGWLGRAYKRMRNLENLMVLCYSVVLRMSRRWLEGLGRTLRSGYSPFQAVPCVRFHVDSEP